MSAALSLSAKDALLTDPDRAMLLGMRSSSGVCHSKQTPPVMLKPIALPPSIALLQDDHPLHLSELKHLALLAAVVHANDELNAVCGELAAGGRAGERPDRTRAQQDALSTRYRIAGDALRQLRMEYARRRAINDAPFRNAAIPAR